MKKVSILIADDDASIRTYLTRFLTSCGYDVESVDSGEAAIATDGPLASAGSGVAGCHDARSRRHRCSLPVEEAERIDSRDYSVGSGSCEDRCRSDQAWGRGLPFQAV